MRTSALIMICFLALLTITGCKKTGVNDVSENATIIYAGDPAADGCGWEVKTASDSTYLPLNLAVQYQVSNLSVNITYHRTGTRTICGFSVPQVATGLWQ